jgi:hypothetical protein
MEQGEVVAPAAPEQRRPKKRQRTVGGNRIHGDDVGECVPKGGHGDGGVVDVGGRLGTVGDERLPKKGRGRRS